MEGHLWDRKDKQPYAIALKSGAVFVLAGIWEHWRDTADGEDIRSFAVITCEPNEMMATIRDRMPALLRARGSARSDEAVSCGADDHAENRQKREVAQ